MIYSDGWISTPHIPPDYRGPQDSFFEKFQDPAKSLPIVGLLDEVCARQPHSPAFVDPDGKEVTFGMFWRAVVQLAGDRSLGQVCAFTRRDRLPLHTTGLGHPVVRRAT